MSRSNITAGNLVAVGEPVLSTLVSIDKVYAHFDANESTFFRLAAPQRAGGKPAVVLMGLSNEENLDQNMPHQGTVQRARRFVAPAGHGQRADVRRG